MPIDPVMSDFKCEPEKLSFPESKPRKPKQVIVQRNPTPTVNRMVEDAYHILGTQLGLFRNEAHLETFTVQKASAFCKLISSLTSLQETERRRTSLLNLDQLSDAELEALTPAARDHLGLEEKAR